jgi:hypothetical protein
MARSRDLEPVDHAHGAVEPAALGLGVAVRADEKGLAGAARAPDHVAHAVDAGVEPGLGEAADQPAARGHVDRRERLAHDPVAVRAEAAQRPEIGQQAVGVDLGHREPPSALGFLSLAGRQIRRDRRRPQR